MGDYSACKPRADAFSRERTKSPGISTFTDIRQSATLFGQYMFKSPSLIFLTHSFTSPVLSSLVTLILSSEPEDGSGFG